MFWVQKIIIFIFCVFKVLQCMQRIPDKSSIFTAEAKAIDLALDFISTCDANNKFIIFF